MVRGLVNKLVSCSLCVAGKWQQQQLRRLSIHEYKGAELTSKYGVNVPKGMAVSTVDENRKATRDVFPNESELVVKSQILAGGRGLGTFKNGLKGGVHAVKADQVEDIAGKVLGQMLVTKKRGCQGKVASKVYLCEKISLVNEMYFFILWDHRDTTLLMHALRRGGTCSEDLAEKLAEMAVEAVSIDVFKGMTDEDAAKVVDGLAPTVADRKDSIEQVKKLYELFCKCQFGPLEINPIAETSDKQLVAADAKLFFDQNAAILQKEIFAPRDPTQEDPREVAGAEVDLYYVGVDGGKGFMSNDAKVAMATMEINKMSEVTCADYEDKFPSRFSSEHLAAYMTRLADGHEHKLCGSDMPIDQRMIILSGSFNPLHDGHIKLLEIAKSICGGGKPCFEISATTAGKPPLSLSKIKDRIKQFEKVGKQVIVSNQPFFYGKACLFPCSYFVLGADTLSRLLMPQYYNWSYQRMLDILIGCKNRRCTFLVAGRMVDGAFKVLRDFYIPEELRDMFIPIPEEMFRIDI